MPLHSFHLVRVSPVDTTRVLARPPTAGAVAGLEHAECMATMRLGASLLSRERVQPHQLAVFAQWEEESALDAFLADHPLGRTLADGWHVRLEFLRRWGSLDTLGALPQRAGTWSLDEPVVAVTLARMRMTQIPRFLHWGRPVERLVRDHPGTTLALAATRPPRTVGTFTVWRSVREMAEMVSGRSEVAGPERHRAAMAERDRRPFHHQFTTLRFRPLAELGTWEGRSDIIPPWPG